jgi:uncharacterized protein YfdQ (DUF2303 family)
MNELSVPVIDRLLELGALSQRLELPDGSDDVVLLPQSLKLESIKRVTPPKRIEELVLLDDCESFCAYVNAYKYGGDSDAATVIFARVSDSGAKLEAILDYHAAEPAWCRHIARFNPQLTTEWQLWCAADRKPMTQVQMAEWLEENANLMVVPTGAELLELVQTLDGKSDVRFNSTVRLHNGANSLNYDEDVQVRGQVSTKNGTIELPREITAAIAPFEGAQPYGVRARLKTKIEGRKLTLWFETVQKHLIIRDNVRYILETVAQKTGIKPYLGEVAD